MQKRLSSKSRKKLTTRGKTKGRAQTPASGSPMRSLKGGLSWLGSQHNLKEAKEDCRACHGTGTIPTPYVTKGMAKLLACKCVPLFPKVD